MKTKNKITEDNYQEIVLKRSIIICWVLLAICLVIKLFGGNFFTIMCDNENFISVCNFVDKSFIRYILYFALFMTESIMLLYIVKPNIKFKRVLVWLYILACILCWVLKVLIEQNIINLNPALVSVFLVLYLYVILAITTKRYIFSFVVVIYNMLLSLLSAVLKSVSLSNFITDSFLITTIFMIDYYILLTLTFLYQRKNKQKKKEV